MKKYSINEFFAGHIDIRCKNDKQKNAVLKECDKHGIIWNGDEKATDFFPDCSVLEISFYGNGRLTQSSGHADRNVVDFDQIEFLRDNCYRIVIDCNGTTTIATMTINGRGIKTAIARRNPADKFDWRKGAALAFERLWDSPRKPEKKPEVRAVQRYAKVGEYIKIVAKKGYKGEKYQNGDVLRVHHYYKGKKDGWVMPNFETAVIGPDEYVVLEGYLPYETAAKKPQKEE